MSDGSAPMPYTEADVVAIAAIFGTLPPGQEAWTTIVDMDRGFARAVLDHLAAAGRLLPEGARANGICGEHAPVLFGAGLDLQVCELTAGHKGWHGRPNGPGEPWMNWTGDMIVSGSTDE